jgi:hypothetical protein
MGNRAREALAGGLALDPVTLRPVIVDRALEPTVGGVLDPAELADRANAGTASAWLTAPMLAAWLASSGLAERDDQGRLRLTREAWALAGQAFG